MKESVVKSFSYTKYAKEVFWLWEEVENFNNKEIMVEFKWKVIHLISLNEDISDINLSEVIKLRLLQEYVRTYDKATWRMYTKIKYKVLEILDK